MLPYLLSQMFRLVALNMNEPEIAAALTDSHHNFFVPKFPPVVVLLSADVGLINFYHSIELGRVSFDHCLADAVRQIPCGAVLHAQSAGQLVSGNSLFRFGDERNGKKPLAQG